MKDTQKRFLGAVLAASSVAGIVAPSVTAMATVVEDENKATAEDLKAVIAEYTTKLEANAIFANYHRVQYAAERLAQYDANASQEALANISKYADKVFTDEVKTIVDKMDGFAASKSMASYDELVTKDIQAMTNKENAEYLMGRLDVWGKAIVFEVDPNYVKATDAIMEVANLVSAGKYDAAEKQVVVAKDAIKAIKTYEVNGAYLEGKLKIEEDNLAQKANLKVVSAEAINAKEVKVVFNKEVDEDSAESDPNYKIVVGKDENKSQAISDIQLQDDNKTVILQLDGKIENGQSYKVEVKNILDANGKKLESYKGDFEVFNDKTAPALLSTEYTGSTVKFTFDEPLDRDNLPTVKIDNTTISDKASNYSFSTDAGEYELTVSLIGAKDSIKDYGKHSVKISGATDYADNTADMITTEYTATEENEKPAVKSIEDESRNQFKIKFNTDVEPLDVNGANFEIKKGNHQFQGVTVEACKDDNGKDKKDEFIVTIGDDKNNDLYDDNETSIKLNIKVKDVKGTNGKIGDEFDGKVTLNKDEEAPVVVDNLNRVEKIKDTTTNKEVDNLIVYFNEDIVSDSNTESKIVVIRDGVRETVDTATSKDKQLRIVLAGKQEVQTGEYKITLEKGAIKDKDGNKNEATTTSINYTNDNADELAVADTLVTKVTPDKNLKKNVIEMEFKDEANKAIKMDKDSALDLSNYMIDGTKLSDSMYKGTAISFKDEDKKDAVEIILARGTVDEQGAEKTLKLSKDLKTDKGQYITNGKDKEHSEDIVLNDDTNPEMSKVEFIKEESGKTSTNVLRVKFTEAIQENKEVAGTEKEIERNIADDFIVRDANGNKIDIAEVKVDEKTNSKDHDTIVIRLKNDISVNKVLTVEATDNKDDNKTGIDLIDYSVLENKMETGKMNTSDKETNKEVYNFANEAITNANDAKKVDDAATAIGNSFEADTTVTNLITALEKKVTNGAELKIDDNAGNTAIAKDGTITHPENAAGDTTGVVKVLVKYGQQTKVVDVNVKVKAKALTNDEIVKAATNAIGKSFIAEKDVTNLVTALQAKVTNGATISIRDTLGHTAVAKDGTITHPENAAGDTTGDVAISIHYGDITAQEAISVTVKAQ